MPNLNELAVQSPYNRTMHLGTVVEDFYLVRALGVHWFLQNHSASGIQGGVRYMSAWAQ